MKPSILRWTPAAIVLIAGSTNSLAGGLFGASFDLSSLNGTNGFVCNGIDSGDYCGQSVSSAGDINGDGIDDLIIGAYRADPNGMSNAGETYVVFGAVGVAPGGLVNLAFLNGTNGFVCNGLDTDDQSGQSVSPAGDINGDGYDDLVIGAFSADVYANAFVGVTYVVFGSATVGASGTRELIFLDGTNGFFINGVDAVDRSGISVSSVGDVNDDGFDDMIIGADFADQIGQENAGESYVVFGAADVGSGVTMQLSLLDGTDGFVLNGIDAFDFSGHRVSGAGDVNGDGISDLIIAASRADQNGMNAYGESYVVFGVSGLGSGGSLDLSFLNGMNGFVLNGIAENDYSGSSVSSAGDINGDGIDDLIIGADGADPNGQSAAGESYVVFGDAGLGSTGVLDLSSLNGTNGFVLNGVDADDESGYSVSAAGDVNGDGIGDLIIGAKGADPNGQSDAGESYVVFGAVGLGLTGTLELSSLNGANGFVCNGFTPDDRSGHSVSSAGDINGDGVGDFIIGAPGAGPGPVPNVGEAYVVFGRTPCPADLNGDGVVDSSDLGNLIIEFGTPGPSADINNDGVVNSSDLGILIGAFGTTSCD